MGKKAIKIGLLAVGFIVMVWSVISLSVAIRTNGFLTEIYNSNGNYKPEFGEFVSPELFSRLDYRSEHGIEECEYTEKHKRTFPIALYAWDKTYVYFGYFYERAEQKTDELLCGSDSSIKLTMELKNGKWRVVDSYEGP
jgi:hypothetical protein